MLPRVGSSLQLLAPRSASSRLFGFAGGLDRWYQHERHGGWSHAAHVRSPADPRLVVSARVEIGAASVGRLRLPAVHLDGPGLVELVMPDGSDGYDCEALMQHIEREATRQGNIVRRAEYFQPRNRWIDRLRNPTIVAELRGQLGISEASADELCRCNGINPSQKAGATPGTERKLLGLEIAAAEASLVLLDAFLCSPTERLGAVAHRVVSERGLTVLALRYRANQGDAAWTAAPIHIELQ